MVTDVSGMKKLFYWRHCGVSVRRTVTKLVSLHFYTKKMAHFASEQNCGGHKIV